MRLAEDRTLGKLVRAGVALRPLARDWRASTADMLERFFGADDAAKCAVGATIGYYADDAHNLAWPFFAIAQAGFLKSGGVFVKGGSRVLSMKLAKIVSQAGGSVLLGRDTHLRRSSSTGPAIPAAVRHVEAKTRGGEQRIETGQVLANCAPHVLAAMLPDAERAKIDEAYGEWPLSISLFSAHFGLSVPPSQLGLDRFSLGVLPGLGGAAERHRRECKPPLRRPRRQFAGLRGDELRRNR